MSKRQHPKLSMKKTAVENPFKGLTQLGVGGLLMDWAVPIVGAGALGSLAGLGLHKLNRRANPGISDSNSLDDLRNIERLQRIQYYKQLIKAYDEEHQLSKQGSDAHEMASWIVNGALAGGGVATLATIVRWIRLNRKLKKLDQIPETSTKDTLSVTVPEGRLPSLDKSASNLPVELIAGAAGGGVLSYAAITWLANKIEARRMQKEEEKARDAALRRFVPNFDGGTSDKSASAMKKSALFESGSGIVDAFRAQHLWEALAFLAAMAITKKRLDREKTNDYLMKPLKPVDTVFVPPHKQEPEDRYDDIETPEPGEA